MVERRWLVRLVPPAAGALAVGLIAATSIGATEAAWNPPACDGGPPRLQAAILAARPAAPDALTSGSWFTLDSVVDASGELTGQRLRIGLGRPGDGFLALPPESTAAGPFGRAVGVVDDDGVRSRIRAVDRAAGCAWELGTSSDVVRRITVDPAARAVFEFRVDRTTRADLGVWRRPLDGGAPTRVLEPLAADAEFGPTFSTSLSWSAAADRLVVQSCGAVRCRTRLLDPSTGEVATLASLDQGELIGVADDRLIAYEPCLGLPCPVVSFDLLTAHRDVVVDAAGLARLVATDDGPTLVAELPGARLVAVGLRDGRRIALAPPSAGRLRLMPEPDRAAAGAALPAGWIGLAPDGRSPGEAILLRLRDGATIRLREVTR